MATVHLPRTNLIPSVDPDHAVAVERGKAAVKKLLDSGVIDAHGNRIRTDLPADMVAESDRDFGG